MNNKVQLICVLKWLRNKVAIACIYASTEEDLPTKIDDLTLFEGSIAYTGDGSKYVLGSEGWANM